MNLSGITEEISNSRTLDPDNLANYERTVRQFGEFLGRPATIEDLSASSVNKWLTKLDARYAPRTVANMRRNLLVVWNFAADRDYCQPPPRRKLRSRKVPKPIPVAWPVEWVDRLFTAARSIPGCIYDGTPRRVYAEALLRMSADLLCRPKDLRLLQWTAVRPNGVVAWIQNKTQTLSSAQLQPETVAILEQLPKKRKNIFWLSKAAQERLIRLVFEAAGIEKPRGQSLGHLRHTGATQIWLGQGAEAAREAIGHRRSSRVMEEHYLDATATKRQSGKWY